MIQLAVGIGAGLVSALLFAVVITGSPLAMVLSFVAPLPIYIAALGWNHRTGLIAAVAGTAALAVILTPTGGFAFGIGWALPAWWIAYLALLGRASPQGTMEWYPLGRLLMWVAAAAALITVLGMIALGDGNYESYQDNLRRGFEEFLQARNPSAEVDGDATEGLIDIFVSVLPLLVAFNFVLLLTLNLWLAAKTVQLSGRLLRPWPAIIATLMPRTAVGGFLAALAASFMPGLPGAAGLAVMGALIAAFTLQGLAFIHDTSRGRPGRTALLSAVYVLAIFVGSISLPLFALLGLADTAFLLRSRIRPGSAGSAPPST